MNLLRRYFSTSKNALATIIENSKKDSSESLVSFGVKQERIYPFDRFCAEFKSLKPEEENKNVEKEVEKVSRWKEQICKTPMIPISTKKLNYLATMIKGLDLDVAIKQMMFLPRDPAKEVLWALKEGANIAKNVQNISPSDLYVAYAYTGRGEIRRRPDIKGRGRSGVLSHRESHMVIMLREKGAKPQRTHNVRTMPRVDRHIINPRMQL
jgi:ribosomal protein L22